MKILLVCTGNTCRSPMAAAMLQRLLEQRGADMGEYQIITAGLGAGTGWPASPGAMYAMQLMGLDISQHRSQALNREMVESADMILTMTATQRECLADKYPQHRLKINTLAQAVGEQADILDPFGQDAVKYVESAREIKRLLEKLVELVVNK